MMIPIMFFLLLFILGIAWLAPIIVLKLHFCFPKPTLCVFGVVLMNTP